MQRIAFSYLRHADVIRLYVPVGDSFALQDDDRLEQVLTESLEQVQTEAALLADALGEGLFTGAVKQNGRAIAKLDDAVTTDESWVI